MVKPLQPEYVDAIIRKVIEDYFADCNYHAEYTMDKRLYNHYASDVEQLKGVLSHAMCSGMAHIIAQKMPKLDKKDSTFDVTFSSQLVILTGKELTNLIAIIASRLCG